MIQVITNQIINYSMQLLESRELITVPNFDFIH